MSRPALMLNQEVKLENNDLIVTKTCVKGKIIYANRRFMEIAGFPEQDLLNQPHNIIRHPDMPKGVYRLMWQTLKARKEFFGFVKNACADGSYYWVFANVTPDLDQHGEVRGFYSVRRKAPESAIRLVEGLYKQMLQIESEHRGTQGIDRSVMHLKQWLDSHGLEYLPAMLKLYRHGALSGVSK